ncbi:CoA ester lyase [Pseudomonas putida]|uniref:HpcH/HpaI aldolase/citrate lyase family protein n=1 Tax=Pseudomonas putida TaxID=303 RepID=UPI0018A95FBB|nr:CoA ester lyase [Pseudomonas putida]MBF8668351.1 CoA ester lyase [Pseudomonas putida]MBF8710830.1 CoA ester lyase [Pseudomonas putida]
MDWPLRSLLFIPAHKVDWAQKASRYRPDAVVLDLEDAVPPHLKAGARAAVAQVFEELHSHNIRTFVRINALEEGGGEDLAAIVHKNLDGVMLPKANSVDQIRELDSLLTYHEGRVGLERGVTSILILPETAVGMHDARLLAGASKRVKGITGAVLGTGAAGDFATALGIWPSQGGLEQNYIVSKLSLDSRAAGAMYPIAVVNGVQIDDLAMVKTLAYRAKESGYTGILVIHPSHLAVVHEVFAPSEEEVEYYQGIIDTIRTQEQEGNGAVRFKGEMIDYAMIARAKQFLKDAERFKK